MTRVLLVDDEPQLAMILEYMLRERGWEVVVASNGAAALEEFENSEFDLIMLDVTMPRVGGLEVCRRIRRTSEVPIVMVTGRTHTEQILDGFEAGADDYITKPFEPTVLMARLSALLRRGQSFANAPMTLGPMSIDFSGRSVRVEGETVALTDVEWRLLSALAHRSGEVLSWRLLLAHAWDVEDHHGGRELVKSTIYRLRRRLGQHGTQLITTVRGHGYVLEDATH